MRAQALTVVTAALFASLAWADTGQPKQELEGDDDARAADAAQALGDGTDAQAEVSVRLSSGGPSVTGKGADPDTLVASARAYIAALNKLTARGERQHAQHAAG